jgi:hypothetical protein
MIKIEEMESLLKCFMDFCENQATHGMFCEYCHRIFVEDEDIDAVVDDMMEEGVFAEYDPHTGIAHVYFLGEVDLQ